MSRKKIWGLSILVVTLTAAVIISSYAYFAANLATSAATNVSVTTKTVDNLTITKGSDISITATQANFASGSGDLTGNTTTTVKLVANNTAAATYCYTIDFNRTANDFQYSSGSTKELTLTVTKGGTTIMNAQDITTGTTKIQVPTTSGGSTYKHPITATAGATTTDTLVATVTFVNLASSQNVNTGKTFTGNLTVTRVAC